MPEENKNQNRNLNQIRLELIALLTQRKKLEEIAIREMEEEKKNPPPWGDLML